MELLNQFSPELYEQLSIKIWPRIKLMQ
jgi:hypothetical protein